MSFHGDGDNCKGCDSMLDQVHWDMKDFFYWAKKMHPDLHIAQGWRNEKDQNDAFAKGDSKRQWPDSKHNHIENGKPCSLALDLFQITPDKKAVFDREFYENLYNETLKSEHDIRWGGTFIIFKDYDHFEMVLNKGDSYAA